MNEEKILRLKKYLPSKKFSFLIGTCILTVLIVLFATSFFGSRHLFSRKGINPALAAQGTLGDVITRDSNNNTIPDWEESLWGLDPKGDGAANKKIVDQKRAAADLAAGSGGTSSDSNGPLTKTEQFSRELLSTILALQQAGALTPEAVANLANSIGVSIDTKQDAAPLYTSANITVVATDAAHEKSYIKSLTALLNQYRSAGTIGSETQILSNGLSDAAPSDVLAGLSAPAAAYKDLGADIVKLKIPKDQTVYALMLANACDRIGTGLSAAKDLYTDAFGGMLGISQYDEGIKSFNMAAGYISDYFTPSS